MLKKGLCLLLCLSIGFGIAATPAAAADTGIRAFSVTAFAAHESTRVNWRYNDAAGVYNLFLPADADPADLLVHVTSDAAVTVNDTPIVDGGRTDAFAGGGRFTVKAGDAAYTLEIVQSAQLPSVYIQTESGSLDAIHANKNHKEAGAITVVENGEATLDGQTLKSVKGRGNATWWAEKKPYNIKFDKKTDLFGMGKAKKWSLLANYYDGSLIRNAVALDAAQALGLPYTSQYRAVDLYINGDYLGNYLVCESVEVGATRVDIADLEDANEDANPGVDIEAAARAGTGANGAVEPGAARGSRKWVNLPNDPADVTGGYLLEMDFRSRYDAEVSGFTTAIGQNVVLKSPEYASKTEVDYIADLYQAAEDAVFSATGYNSLDKHYSEYFDMDSLVGMYILLEYTMCLDAGNSSCFFYKAAGDDRLYAGPAWDFDNAMANPNQWTRFGFNLLDPTIWWANAVYYSRRIGLGTEHEIPTIFNALYRHEDFRSAVAAAWAAQADATFGPDAADAVGALIEKTSASAVMDAIRWGKLSGDDAAAKLAAYKASAGKLTDYVTARKTALDKGFAPDAAMLYYEANGGSGRLYNDKILSIGDSVTVKAFDAPGSPIAPPDENHAFAGWNTMPDGSGAAYNAGDSLTVDAATTVLYAQWKDISQPEPAPDAPAALTEKMTAIIRSLFSFFMRIWRTVAALFGR